MAHGYTGLATAWPCAIARSTPTQHRGSCGASAAWAQWWRGTTAGGDLTARTPAQRHMMCSAGGKHDGSSPMLMSGGGGVSSTAAAATSAPAGYT
jgi:hypothetical protein